MKNSKILKSFLPVFPGFYGTWFECNCEESCIEDDKEWSDYEWDYEDYRQRVAKACVLEIESQLSEFGIKVKFDMLYSPLYYNFINDRIYVTYTIPMKGYRKLLKYLYNNEPDFDTYIRGEFTSRSGFTSFYSNDYREWLQNMEKENVEDFNFIGTILDFYFENEGYSRDDLLVSNSVNSEISYVGCTEKDY